MWKQWIYNKLQTTDYTQEQEGQIRQKTFKKKACADLKDIEKTNKTKTNGEWWEEKTGMNGCQ